MRWGTRKIYIAIAASGALSGATFWYSTRKKSTKNVTPIQLSAEEFNALQNKDLLNEAFGITHLPWSRLPQHKKKCDDGRDFRLTLYRLLGCPYCAKVEWVLRYHCVPFDMVDVDTISGAGIPDPRYTLVPQICLSPMIDASNKILTEETGAYVVDSQKIISAISVPLGFSEQLQDKRVVETCRWITERFQAVSFAATNSTWSNAFASYPYVTPPKYHNIFFRVVGASVLFMLSRYKIQPSLINQENNTYKGLHKDSAIWLEEELNLFISRLQDYPHQRFHGGKEPDIADVEMYAVTRVVDAHPKLNYVLHKGNIGEWNSAMDAELRKRTQIYSP